MSNEKNTPDQQQGYASLAGVVRSADEIENRIKEIKEERQELLQDYIKANDENERDVISLIATEKALTIKELEWFLGV